ncbi:MAG: hypothetical protein D6720_12475 [Gammaproteobacteria bacterium]|nr:MAG: hypothetical protein D6720_12475 [Gammaproteobacteria bacterium]
MQAFLRTHQLPASYVSLAKRWFESLAEDIARYRAMAGRPLIVGINGSQGSGKSTLAALLRLLLGEGHGLKVIDLSIDDFYLTRCQREELARRVHPLLVTRGVPGTHDTRLMARTLKCLSGSRVRVPIPRFDKAQDDRVPAEEWAQVQAPMDVVILEGWCLGTPPEAPERLETPINELERIEDLDGVWRRYVNDRIERDYRPVYDRIDIWIMLQAPSFQRVYRWRLEQEEKLARRQAGRSGSGDRIMSAPELARFIQHYQRLTEQALRTLPERVHYLYRLDAERQIIEARCPRPVELA